MQDHFLEEVVVKHKNGIHRARYLFSWVVIVVSGLAAAMSLSGVTSSLAAGSFDWASLIMLLASGGICAYTFLFHDKLLTEYE